MYPEGVLLMSPIDVIDINSIVDRSGKFNSVECYETLDKTVPATKLLVKLIIIRSYINVGRLSTTAY